MRASHLVIVRALGADEVGARAAELLELQRAAYAVEAALIGDDRIPPLHESESDLVQAGLSWTAALDHDRLAGAAGYSVVDGTVDLDRLMIRPTHHRRGIGTSLVRHLQSPSMRTIVSTGRENAPARALYESLGFRHGTDVEAAPGLWVSRYSWEPPAP